MTAGHEGGDGFKGAPTAAPEPDVWVSEDGMHLNLCEGMHLVVGPSPGLAPRELFLWTLSFSILLGGKPVRCTGFLPGVSLRMHSQLALSPLLTELVSKEWEGLQGALQEWVEQSEHMPCVALPVLETEAFIALDRFTVLPAGVVEIEQRYN